MYPSNQNKNQGGLTKYLKNFDLFGENISFTLDGRSKVTTIPGIFLSFLLFSAFCGMFFFMGQSFFFRIDPVTTTAILESPESYIFDASQFDNMFIAFQAKNLVSSVMKIDNTLLNVMGWYYPLTNEGSLTVGEQNKPVYPTLCSKLYSINRSYLPKGINLNEFYCLDFSTMKYMNGENYKMIVEFSFCQYSDVNNPNCRDDLVKTLLDSGNLSITLYYPSFTFDPNSKEGMKLKHSKVNDYYFHGTIFKRFLYLKNYNFRDDKGLIFEDYTSENHFVVGDMQTIHQYSSSDYYFGYYYILTSGRFETQTRKYQKFQDVLAVTGGVIKIIQIALSLIATMWIKIEKNLNIINKMISWNKNEQSDIVQKQMSVLNLVEKPHKPEDQQQAMRNQIHQNIKDVQEKVEGWKNEKQNLNFQSTPIKLLEEPIQDQIKNLFQSSKVSHTHDIVKHADCSMKKSGFELDISTKKFIDLNAKALPLKNVVPGPSAHQLENNGASNPHKTRTKLTELNFTKKLAHALNKQPHITEGRFDISCWDKLQHLMMFRCCGKKKQSIQLRIYKHAEAYIKAQLDIFGYFDILFDIKTIKRLLFNPSQQVALHYIQKPLIPLTSGMEENHLRLLKSHFRTAITENDQVDEIDELCKYFTEKMNTENLSETDKAILTSMDFKIIEKILKIDKLKDPNEGNLVQN